MVEVIGYVCPACNRPLAGHDDGACGERMAGWGPTGRLVVEDEDSNELGERARELIEGLPEASGTFSGRLLPPGL